MVKEISIILLVLACVSVQGLLFENSLNSVVLTCPTFECSETQSNSTCINTNNNTYYITDCINDYFCEFNLIGTPNGTCLPDSTKKPASNNTCEGIYLSPGSVCSENTYCSANYYCDHNSICTYRSNKGDNCTNIYQCKENSVCNQGICIEKFSLPYNSPADSKYACSSGVVFEGKCQKDQKTNGKLPKKCQTNSDCTISNGENGTCTCGLDGNSYCELHSSDSISLKLLSAIYNDNYHAIKYYFNRKKYFVYIESLKNLPVGEKTECLWNSKELWDFDESLDNFKKCSNGLFLALGLSFLLIS